MTESELNQLLFELNNIETQIKELQKESNNIETQISNYCDNEIRKIIQNYGEEKQNYIVIEFPNGYYLFTRQWPLNGENFDIFISRIKIPQKYLIKSSKQLLTDKSILMDDYYKFPYDITNENIDLDYVMSIDYKDKLNMLKYLIERFKI